MTIEVEPRKYEVSLPDNADFEVGIRNFDPADPDSMFNVTVHKTPAGAAGNVWHKSGGVLKRVMPEWELYRTKPTPEMLLGTLLTLGLLISNRLVKVDEKLMDAAIRLSEPSYVLVEDPNQRRIILDFLV